MSDEEVDEKLAEIDAERTGNIPSFGETINANT